MNNIDYKEINNLSIEGRIKRLELLQKGNFNSDRQKEIEKYKSKLK